MRTSGVETAAPFGVLVRIELLKVVNTRSGRWLTMGLLAICAAMTAAMVGTGGAEHLSFQNMWGMLNLPMSFLLPVLAILLVTGEWSQRTALVTFALEPRRRRVLAAKLSTSVVLTAAVVLTTAAFAAVGTALALAVRDGVPGWRLDGDVARNLVLLQFAHILEGFGFGLLLRSSAPAIVTYFVLPNAWNLAGSLLPWMPDRVRNWLDLAAAQGPFQNGEAPFESAHAISGSAWAQLAVAIALWCLLPVIVGARRAVRAEVT